MTGSLVQVSAGWVPAAAVLLLAVAAVGAVLDGMLAARAEGQPAALGAATPVLETARLLRQRRRWTVAADRPLQMVGTAGLVVVALLMVVVVPFGRWTLSDLPVGVVWFNALDVAVWALVWLAGWGPNSAHALIGGYRFLAQALAYELPLMFAITAPAVAAGSLAVGDVVAAQEGLWFVVWMPVAFLVFCGAVLAFSLRGPFSAPSGVDLAGGVLVDSSGIDRWLLLVGRWALMAAGSAFAVAIFLGGGHGPVLPSWLWSLVKTTALLFVLARVRRSLPTVRPDRLMPFAWVVVLPAVLLQLLVVAVVVVGRG